MEIPDNSSHRNEYLFLKTLRENFLFQHVLEPTRQRGSDTPRILDLVITNEQFISDIDYMSPLGKSDHCIIRFDCLFGTDTTVHSNKLNFNKGNYDELRNYIKEDWDSTFSEIENVEEMYGYLKNKILNGMKQFIPNYVHRANNKQFNKLFPFNNDIKTLIHQKHRKWTRLMETSPERIQNYKK